MVSRKQPLSFTCRSVAMAAIAALAFDVTEAPSAIAGTSRPVVAQSASVATAGDVTDFSARRRHRRYRGSNPAAGLAIMGAMIGTIGAIAAHQHDDDYYYYGPGYYGGPGYYYGPPPVYYAPRPYYYGPRVYRYYPY